MGISVIDSLVRGQSQLQALVLHDLQECFCVLNRVVGSLEASVIHKPQRILVDLVAFSCLLAFHSG